MAARELRIWGQSLDASKDYLIQSSPRGQGIARGQIEKNHLPGCGKPIMSLILLPIDSTIKISLNWLK
jgi:hypothetical protein